MDWGILDRNAGENRFLREEIVYAYKVSVIELLVIIRSRRDRMLVGFTTTFAISAYHH